jgi:hypothetical protein
MNQKTGFVNGVLTTSLNDVSYIQAEGISMPRSRMVIQNAQAHNSNLSVITNRLFALKEKLSGVTPENPSPLSDEVTPQGFFGMIESIQRTETELLEQMGHYLSQIEQLFD